MTSYRVTLTPSQGSAKVFQIGQPTLRVTIAQGSGGTPAVAPIPSRAAAGEVVQVVGYTVAGGGYDGDTLAKIAAKQALGWPDYAIWVRVMGEANTVPVSASASVPSFAAFATLTAPAVTAGFNATVTMPQFSSLAVLTPTSVSAVMNATATVPQFAASAMLAAPSVTAGYSAIATVASFTAASAFSAPAIAAQKAALVNVPSFGAASTLAPPAVSVTPAGATAATASVPSFAAAATFTTPTVAAQLAATVAVPQFSAYAAITPPTVTAQRQGMVSVASFGAVSTLATPTVTGVQQQAATATVPQFSAITSLAPPTVTAQRQAIAAVPSFGAAASLTAPQVTAVQLAAAVSATVTGPSFTAQAALTAPTVSATASAAAKVSVSDDFNRANGGLGSNWTTAGGMNAPTTVNNLIGGADTGGYWSAATFADRQWAKMSCYPGTLPQYQSDALGSCIGGPQVRINGSAGYFASTVNYDDGGGGIGFVVTLWRRNGKNYTRFPTYYESFTPDEYPWIKVTADGSTLKVFGSTTENGAYTELISETDTTTATGSVGFAKASDFTALDNWSGGDL